MARSKESFGKREKEKRRQNEKKQKREKMQERQANQVKGKSLDDMLAYIDENGNISSTPPDPGKMRPVNAEDIEIGVPKMVVDNGPRVGKINYFDRAKGFGFILQDNGEQVFFHISQTSFPVKEGDQVTYSIERGPKDWQAVNITKKP